MKCKNVRKFEDLKMSEKKNTIKMKLITFAVYDIRVQSVINLLIFKIYVEAICVFLNVVVI